jgi:Fur family transcriptional regulator, ferric uptake regulator
MIATPNALHSPAPMQLTPEAMVELACARLRTAQLRVTKPRVSILTVLARQATPVSIEELHSLLQLRSCDLVTVYRCLAAFEEVRLVRRSYHFSGTCLYELVLAGRPERHHVICRVCEQVDSVDAAPLGPTEAILLQRGYVQLTHAVGFFGVCPTCRQKGRRPVFA